MHSNQSSEYPLCCKKGGGKWLMHIWIKVQLKDAALSYSCYSSIRSRNTPFPEGKREELLDSLGLIAQMNMISVHFGVKILIERELVKVSQTAWSQFDCFFYTKWSLSCLVFSERTYSSQHWPFETDRTVWYCMTFISLLDEKNIYFCFAYKWTTFSNIIFYTSLHTTWLLVHPLFSDGHSGLLLLLLKLKKPINLGESRGQQGFLTFL